MPDGAKSIAGFPPRASRSMRTMSNRAAGFGIFGFGGDNPETGGQLRGRRGTIRA
jgi:hypothetical protein